MFRAYGVEDREACLSIFDENCPKYFAPNEREDYGEFLDQSPAGYELCLSDGVVVGAYGLTGEDPERRGLNWILLSPRAQGLGLGAAVMERVLGLANERGIRRIDIAASHLSRGFFEKYGAVAIDESIDGWGPGMHRIDMVLAL